MVVYKALGGTSEAGAASSYTVAPPDMLTPISRSVPDHNTAPCWVVITRGGIAFTSNTGSGTISAYSIDPMGNLDADFSKRGQRASGPRTRRISPLGPGDRDLFVVNFEESVDRRVRGWSRRHVDAGRRCQAIAASGIRACSDAVREQISAMGSGQNSVAPHRLCAKARCDRASALDWSLGLDEVLVLKPGAVLGHKGLKVLTCDLLSIDRDSELDASPTRTREDLDDVDVIRFARDAASHDRGTRKR